MIRESMDYDIVIVGAGPAGLATAIQFKQLCQQYEQDYRICIVEKGAEVGSHILSGAVFEPQALNELIPDWRTGEAPIFTPATDDQFLLLTASKAWRLPTPSTLRNEGNYIISLGSLCRWLAKVAESLGVDIFPGFAAVDFIYDAQGSVVGIITNDMGCDKSGRPKPAFQPGMALRARYTILAEGCRGSLSEKVMQRFQLRAQANPQTYGLGVKELWQVDPEQHKLGTVIHTVGWPLNCQTYGGSFIYHLENYQVAVGFVVGLDYKNPYLSPFDELQRFKTHPKIHSLFERGKRLCYGARAINEGGWQSIPKLTFPGGLLVGCSAGFLNVAKIKGTHTAMKSGMLAAETLFDALRQKLSNEPIGYSEKIKRSWINKELYRVRNIRPAFKYGLYLGLGYAALDTYILRGKAPWTFRQTADHFCLKKAADCQKIVYSKPDGKITFDKLSSVYISNTMHTDNQPCHLTLRDNLVPIDVNYRLYSAPEQYYCPAAVYEILVDSKTQILKLQINAQNCIHCKTCDIKDPTQNIVWIPPEGGGGPNYWNM